MKKVFENWKNFITEDSRDQVQYISMFNLRRAKETAPNLTEILRWIRAVPNVTQVDHVSTITESDVMEIGEYRLKFVLKEADDPRTYIDRVLRPGINKIEGLSIIRLQGYEEEVI